MTEQMEAAPVGDGKTSDQLLEEIEAAQRQLEEQGNANSQPKEPEGTSDQVKTSTTDKPTETADTSEPAEDVPAPQGSDKSGEVEELMKKKGFKTVEDIVRSYRNLERKMHGQGKGLPKEEPKVIQFPPQQVQPPVVPEYRPIVPNAGLQQLAEAYQMTPDDIQKIAQLANDIADFKLKQRIEPLMKDFKEVKRDLEKENSFKRLEKDPLFRNREVQLEMHRLAEDDPSILSEPDYPERLFDRALSKIGRRFAEGSIQVESATSETRTGIPSTPPPSGRGSASGPKGIPIKPPTTIPKDFKRLSVAEMEKELRRLNAFREE